VITTREGKGAIDDRHALSVGTMWVNRRLRPMLDAADVVLAVGTRFQGMGLQPGQQLVHLDVDPDQIGRNHPVDVVVAGDAQLGLAALAELLASHAAARTSRADEAQAMRSVEERSHAVGPGADGRPCAGIPDDGSSCAHDDRRVHVPCTTGSMPRTYLSTSYMGTLGFGYRPRSVPRSAPRPAGVAVVGDGGFGFTLNELATRCSTTSTPSR
jgi:acetolactate synthase-1/2/3 large subunit